MPTALLRIKIMGGSPPKIKPPPPPADPGPPPTPDLPGIEKQAARERRGRSGFAETFLTGALIPELTRKTVLG